MTVEQLAYETGMSVRNIRNHQSRGLLPPPEVRARTGYYGPDHVARLRLIQEMQAEGFKLSAISRLIGEHGADADRFVGLRQAVTAPFDDEAPEVLTREELNERFGGDDPKVLAKALKLGLLVDLGDERYEAPSPTLLRAAEEVLGMGIPLAAALATIEKLSRASHSERPRLRLPLPRRALEALRRRRPPRRGLAEDDRRDRAPPPDRRRRDGRHLPPLAHRRSRQGLRRSPRTGAEEMSPAPRAG